MYILYFYGRGESDSGYLMILSVNNWILNMCGSRGGGGSGGPDPPPPQDTGHTQGPPCQIRNKKNSIWKCNVTYKYYSNGIAYRCLLFLVFRRYITVHVFCKICRKYSSNAHWLRLVSVLAGFLFDMQIDFEDPIDICLEIVVWKFKPAR